MPKLWVKLRDNSTQVSTETCSNVDDFLKACKKELSPHFDSVAIDQLSLSTTAGGNSLRPGLLLTAIPSQPGYSENDDDHPLFISVADASTQGIAGSLTKEGPLSSEPSLKCVHPKRRERWEKLNAIFDKNRTKLESGESSDS